MSGRMILAVDGGNSKTDLALVAEDGRLLAFERGPSCSPHRVGVGGCATAIEILLGAAHEHLDGAKPPRPAAAVVMVAGVDREREQRELRAHILERDWADVVEVGNDTLALLAAGSDSEEGVAIVCGAGVNALGVGPDGRLATFASLGALTGDWGGGEDLGVAAVGASVRAGDGRGAPTELARLVSAHFGMASAEEVAFAVHDRELEHVRLAELGPLVLDAAERGDDAALALRERSVEEIATFARAAAARALDGVDGYDVVLGGSLLSRSETFGRLALERVQAELPASRPSVCAVMPVAGSALIALGLIGARDGVAPKVRAALTHDLHPDAVLRNGAPR
jgi:N-acetylglucosamine kinase-like BadF-type ATPase